MTALEVLKELLVYLSTQLREAERNEQFADLHHCVTIATHYRVAKTCYQDAKKTLLYLAEEQCLELLPGDE